MAFNHFKWREKQFKKEGKILKRALKRKLTDAEKLELLELSIYPYSRDGRFGMKKALKHSIKLLKNEQKSPLKELEKELVEVKNILKEIIGKGLDCSNITFCETVDQYNFCIRDDTNLKPLTEDIFNKIKELL